VQQSSPALTAVSQHMALYTQQAQRAEGLELHVELLRRASADGDGDSGGSDAPSRVLRAEIKSLKGRLKESVMTLASRTAEADRCIAILLLLVLQVQLLLPLVMGAKVVYLRLK
jgi:hypothetical protein